MNYETKLYHIVPPRVEGTEILPLEQLKQVFPELYQRHAQKYVGREDLLQQEIPGLGCNWYNVIQLSPVHPEEIRDQMTAVGFGWRPLLVFEIDADQSDINHTNAVIYKNLFKKQELQSHGFRFSPSDFETFSPENLSRYSCVPQATIDHFKSAKENSETPLMFLWVPHVLYSGKINVEKLKILEIS